MAKQIINIGAVANDGTGDPLRTAMQKANENFTELYNSIGDVAKGTFTTAYPATPEVGLYLFAGTDGATVGGVTYHNGDSAFWNGTSWVKIPSISLVNYLTKEQLTSLILFSGFDLANGSTLTDSKYLDATGAVQNAPNATYKISSFIEVKGQTSLTYKGNLDTNTYVCYYDKNQNFISSQAKGADPYTVALVVPAGTYYLRASYRTAASYLTFQILSTAQINEARAQINELLSVSAQVTIPAETNIASGITLTAGYYLAADGSQYPAASTHKVSDYIKTYGQTSLKYRGCLYSTLYVCYYDFNKKFISSQTYTTDFYRVDLEVPETAVYLRASYREYAAYLPFQIINPNRIDYTRYYVDSILDRLSNIPAAIDEIYKKDYSICVPNEIYTVCDNFSTNLALSNQKFIEVIINHLIYFSDNIPVHTEVNGIDKKLLPVNISDNPTSTSTSFNGGVDVLTTAHSFEIKGLAKTKTVAFNQKSTKASVGSLVKVALMCIGDSVTEGVNTNYNRPDGIATAYWEYVNQLFRSDKAKNGGSGFDFKTIGTRKNLRKSTSEHTFTLNGTSYTVNSYSEGVASWNLFWHMNHPAFVYSTGYGNYWDVLGLLTIVGRAYSGSAADILLLQNTAYGKYASDKTAKYVAHFSAADVTAADIAYANLLANPTNKFYDFSVFATEGHCFSLSTYLSRYKTLSPDTFARLTVGVDAGTNVTDANAYDVCLPTHIYLAHCFNNDYSSEYSALVSKFITHIQTYYTSLGKTCNIGLGAVDFPGLMHPEYYPEFANNISQYSQRIVRTLPINNLYKSLHNVSNKIFHVPVYAIQPQGYDMPYHDFGKAETLSGNTFEKGKKLLFNSNGGSEFHPNSIAHAAWGYEIYAWIKYTLTL